MSGKGFGKGKGKGKGLMGLETAKPATPVRQRHRRIMRDNIRDALSTAAVRRLARRGGVKRLSGLMYEEIRGIVMVFLEPLVRDAICYSEHARRKTLSAMDVVMALKKRGTTLYGFDR